MGHFILYVTIVSITLLFSCNTAINEKKSTEADAVSTGQGPNGEPEKYSFEKFSDRLKISGDFNGDTKIDTLFESYISSLTQKETSKRLDSTDWEKNVELIIKNKPLCRLYSNIDGVDTLIITRDAQQIGIALLEDLGDLNREPGDELGYIINWADDSNINSYYIISLSREKKWKQLFRFQINESVNYEPENLFNNKSLIIKDGPKKIKYKFYSDSATVEEGKFSFQ